MRDQGSSTRTFALQWFVAALVAFAGAGSLLMASRVLPAAPRSPAIGFFLWSTVALLALGGAVLLALAGKDLGARARQRRSSGPRSSEEIPR